jgi:hypothetical protein
MCSFVLIAVFFFSIFSSTWSPFCIAMMPFSSRVSSFKKLYSPVASTTLVEPKRARLTDDISSNIKNIIEARKAHRSWERQNNEKNQQEDSESRGNKGNGRLLDNGILGKRKRNSDGYDPNISRDSKYYKDYCSPIFELIAACLSDFFSECEPPPSSYLPAPHVHHTFRPLFYHNCTSCIPKH